MREPPPTLNVHDDLDAVRISLGPARHPLLRPGVSVFLALGLVGACGAMWLDSLPAAMVIGGASQLAALVYRLRRWKRHEAPLRLSLERDHLRLTRTFRRQVLHEEVVPLREVTGCRAEPSGLAITTRERTLRLATHFRSAEELEWSAAAVREAVATHGASGRSERDEAALAALAAVTRGV